MKKIAPTILICALLVLACNETLEPTTSKPYIKVGETENMLVNNIDTLFVATRNHGEKNSYLLDINNDGIFDFQYGIAYWGNPDGDYKNCHIYCLNPSAALNVYTSTDSIYFSTKTSSDNSGTWIEIYERWICNDSTESDSLMSIVDRTNINTFYTDDIISISDSWVTDSLIMYESPSYTYDEQVKKGDTTITTYIREESICRQIPVDDDFYIGIRLNINEIDKLGWIKIKYRREDCYIYETAIQR